MKNKISAILLTLASFATAFENKAPIEINSARSEVALIKVHLNQEVYPELRPDFRDLVVLTENKRSIPFSLIQDEISYKKAYTTYQRVGVKNVQLNESSISVDIQLTKRTELASIRISTPLKDFQFKVSVKDETGKTLTINQSIYDYSSFTTSRNEVVKFRKTALKNFSVTISGLSQLQTKNLFEQKEVTSSQGTSEKITTSSINLKKPRFGFAIGNAKSRVTKQKIFESVKKDLVGCKITDLDSKTVVKINTNGMPLSSLTLGVEDKNFSRKYSLTTGGLKSIPLASGTLESWKYKKFFKKSLTVNFRNCFSKELILTIYNGQETPLRINNLFFQIPRKSLYFLEEPGHYYFAHFSDQHFKGKSLPLPAEILQDHAKALSGRFGDIVQQDTDIESPKAGDRTKVWMTFLVILVIGFLIWVIVGTLRKATNEV